MKENAVGTEKPEGTPAGEAGASLLQETAGEQKSRLLQDVKQKLIALRKGQSLTQREIGEATGMRTANITRLEREDYDPSIEILERYAQALGKTLQIDIIDKKTGKTETLSDIAARQPAGEVLDKSEQRLIAYYRSLNPKGKKMLGNMAKDIGSLID